MDVVIEILDLLKKIFMVREFIDILNNFIINEVKYKFILRENKKLDKLFGRVNDILESHKRAKINITDNDYNEN